MDKKQDILDKKQDIIYRCGWCGYPTDSCGIPVKGDPNAYLLEHKDAIEKHVNGECCPPEMDEIGHLDREPTMEMLMDAGMI